MLKLLVNTLSTDCCWKAGKGVAGWGVSLMGIVKTAESKANQSKWMDE